MKLNNDIAAKLNECLYTAIYNASVDHVVASKLQGPGITPAVQNT